jgi:hypothetical protein
MTARKGFKPKSAELSDNDNRWFEKTAVSEIRRMPTGAWESMDALWRFLPLAHPATRKRLLSLCLHLAVERGDGFSAKLLMRFSEVAIPELQVSRSARSHAHDEKKLLLAAQYRARNPSVSRSATAAAVGLPGKKTTIRGYPRFIDGARRAPPSCR